MEDNGKNMQKSESFIAISIIIVIILYLPAACYGMDLGMGWIGFLKMLTVLFFGCCTMQLSEEQRDRMLGMIPAVGCTMTVFGIFSYGIKPAYHFFFMADRLGGFFQYANVFALFCLTGLVLNCRIAEKS